ncbi:phosphonate ABC transporter, permease protein PhnE [Natrarchaeobaculum sulfurireducens]|uniref:ABC-type phosphate/phosphonate transport system,permease component n=1 Tax=Natrarchaeobaculum sulfurireducens TaxID=2044521 RepID=A0A346PAX6_9EURY|nr:phosphonate ABC transporter, permease protein PhnE [Natrarchaeobaculum sulfurireducens]AXR76671.1 ABC-type phosphate/phosphonate transport system,permease component [Natrarchaeobaculum sulfurireducens]
MQKRGPADQADGDSRDSKRAVRTEGARDEQERVDTDSLEPMPDGGVVDQQPSDGDDEINRQFESIKETRKQRAIGWAALAGLLGFLTYQGFAATEFFDDDTDFTWGHFSSRMTEYFPMAEITDLGGFSVRIIDVRVYWEFIRDMNLIYDPEVGSLIFQFPVNLTDLYAFVFVELGIFSIFGEAGTTLAMGLVGTVLGFPLALLFSILATERVLPFPFNFVFRAVMSFIRAIPAIIWALIFVALVGLGATAATLAIGFNTIGNLGRLFVEDLEELEDGPIEAMQTTGANKSEIVFFGMLSQVRTSFIAWTLYIFEINVRAAVTVGVIGAGGLGAIVAAQQNQLNYQEMMATLFVIFVLILLVELFSQRLRARLRSDEEKRSWRELIFGFPARMADSLRQ